MKKPTKMVLHKIYPSVTDPAIVNFNYQHFCYVPTTPNGEIVVMFPATGMKASSLADIAVEAQTAGFFVIVLEYKNATAGVVDCNLVAGDGNYFDNFCMEVYDGTDRSPLVDVNLIDCTKNRLVKLLQYLVSNYPTEAWDQFIADGEPVWPKYTLLGPSQGSFHSLVIGGHFPVKRIIGISGITDLCYPTAIAAWPPDYPVEKCWFLNHLSDDFDNRVRSIAATGMTDPWVDTYVAPQSEWGRNLMTSYPVGAQQPHLLPFLHSPAAIHAIWVYMLTAA